MKSKGILLLVLFLYTNTIVNAQFGDQIIISENILGASNVCVGDIDGDGDIDVISAAVNGDKVVWHENTDGLGNFDIEHTVSDNLNEPNSLFFVDIDGDGDPDIVTASAVDNKISWHENTDGLGTFTEHIITTYAAYAVSIFAGDMDGDGDIDVLSTSANDDKLSWYKNTDGLGTFGPQINILSIDASKLYCADFDGDGDLDILYTSYHDDSINWMANDGFGNFGGQQVISELADAAQRVFAADIDGDGDMDALSCSTLDNKVAWYKNSGSGMFGDQEVISINAMGVVAIYAADMDGDGDIDVLSASLNDNKIAWYENMDGLGNFSDEQIISTNAQGASSVWAGDFDGDGDLDVVSASRGDNKVAWYKNSVIATSIAEKTSFDFSAYPIPTSASITIQSKTSLSQIEIYNLTGMLLLENQINNGSNPISVDISKLSSGIYFIKGTDRNGDFGVKKIVKE